MPNMIDDGFIDQSQFVHTVAQLPTNPDYNLQVVVSNAIASAAVAGAFTAAVNVSAYSNTLAQLMIERLVNMGYTASLSTNTLTINW